MRVDFCLIRADRPDVVERAQNPEGFSEYRRNKILSLKPFRSKCLSAAAGTACEIGFAKAGLKESELEYGFNEHGKPYVKDHPEIIFNLSHSGDYAVAAFVNRDDDDVECSVGVDIEQIERVNSRVVSKMKKDVGFEPDTGFAGDKCVAGQNSDDRYAVERLVGPKADLCRRWTATEAFLKCIGTGLASIDEDFYFEKTPSGHIRLCQDIYEGEFSVIEADAPPGYCITCVVRRQTN